MKIFAAFLLISFPLSGMTLQEALERALQSYPGLKADYQEVRASAARIDLARSGYRPIITARGEGGELRFYSSFTDVSTKLHPKFGTIGVTQPLYRGGRTIAGIRKARHLNFAERFNYCQDRESLLLETATRYIDSLREQEVLKANRTSQEYLGRELQSVQDRFDVGDVTQTDLFQSKARLAGADARVTESLGRQAVVLAELEKFTGIQTDDLIYPDFVPNLPYNVEALTSVVLEKNRELNAQREVFRAATHAYREIKGELYPELNFEYRIDHTQDFTTQGEFTNEIFTFLNLFVPLYQAGSVYARLKEAAAIVWREKFLYEELYRDLEKRSVQAWEAMITAKSQIESFGFQVKANQVALEGVRLEESEGLRTVLDVLNAELEVLNATVNYIDARRNKFVAELVLLQLMGSLYDSFFEKCKNNS